MKGGTLLFSFFMLSLCSRAQVVSHTYQFYNTLTQSSSCGDSLIPVQAAGNCNASTSAGVYVMDSLPACALRRPVYHTNLHWGLRYSNASSVIQSTYTIHLYLKNTTWSNAVWARIIDFSNGTTDAGIYFKSSGSSPDRCIDFYPSGIVGPCPYFNDSTYYLLTFTRDGVTKKIDVYVNNTLFTSYLDASNRYVGTAGVPIHIYRDDQVVPCESGAANFAYLSFTNQYSDQATVDSVYNHICSIANTFSNDFSYSPAQICSLTQPITFMYTGTVQPPGTGYTFIWNWDGGNVVSGAGMGPYSVLWSTAGIKNVSLKIINNTCGDSIVRSIPVTIQSPTIVTINQSICEGQSYQGYTLSGTYADTFPRPGTCDSIRILQLTIKPKILTTILKTICQGGSYLGYNNSGTYLDTFTAANGCDSIRALILTVNPVTSTALQKTICEGDNFLGYTLPGSYVDTFLSANGCDSIRTLQLQVRPAPKPNLGNDRDLCEGDSAILSPGIFSSYLWQDNSTLDHLVVKQPGTYSVKVTDSCGTASHSINVRVHNCAIVFPSAFTPNGDGRNDRFGPTYTNSIKNYRLKIYNRWGQLMFQTNDHLKSWDGTINGLAQETGVFAWVCTFEQKGKQQQLKGTVVLIR